MIGTGRCIMIGFEEVIGKNATWEELFGGHMRGKIIGVFSEQKLFSGEVRIFASILLPGGKIEEERLSRLQIELPLPKL